MLVADSLDVVELRQKLREREAWLTAAGAPALRPWDAAMAQRVDTALAAWEQAGRRIAFDGAKGWHQGIDPHLLPSLAVAYQRQDDPRLGHLARAIVEAVMQQEPWHEGWQPEPGFNPLAIPHRLGDTECAGWFGALPALLDSDAFDDALVLAVIASAAAQLDYLSGHLRDGRNIRLSQADALLTQGLRLTLLPQSDQWRRLGVHVLNDGFHRLIAPDGASREATAWYHTIIMNMGLRLWRLKQADPSLGLTIDRQTVARMFDYTLASVEPDGRATRIGDTLGRITPTGSLASLIERRAEALRELGLPDRLPDPTQVFGDVGQAMIRTDWSEHADYLTFDATERMGFHWHPARNSVQLCVAGHRMLMDPGRLALAEAHFRDYATQTRAHSTVNLNGWQQAEGPARLSVQRDGDCCLIDGLYSGGYWPMTGQEHGTGLYARHQRSVLWMGRRFLLVIDHLTHTAGEGYKPDVAVMWQFSPGEAALEAASRRVRVVRGEGAAALDMRVVLGPESLRMSVHKGQHDPLLGWVASDRTDRPEPAPCAQVRMERYDPWHMDMATLLVPGRGCEPAACEVIAAHDARDANCCHVELQWANGDRDRFWWTRQLATALDAAAGLTTDAGLLHLHEPAGGGAAEVTIAAGTFAGDREPPRPVPGLYRFQV